MANMRMHYLGLVIWKNIILIIETSNGNKMIEKMAISETEYHRVISLVEQCLIHRDGDSSSNYSNEESDLESNHSKIVAQVHSDQSENYNENNVKLSNVDVSAEYKVPLDLKASRELIIGIQILLEMGTFLAFEKNLRLINEMILLKLGSSLAVETR